ncbi:MAG: ABC transporter permease [Chlamydiota bacterium]|nr:ABC transporter permease [Chlamydiota bacterium]
MKNFIFRKSISIVATLFVVVTVTFLLMKFIPGDPFQDEQALPFEIHQSLLKHYGLDESLPKQYFRYVLSVIRWDFGPSFVYKGRSVNQLISQGFPISFLLGAEAIFIALGSGLIIGTVSGMKKNKWVNNLSLLFVILGLSIPNFACATFLQYFLAVKYHIFPVARWGSFIHSILPALSLAALPAAFIAKLVRAQIEDVLQQGYIKTAIAKGLNEKQVMFKHVLRNALLPVVAYLGQITANILVGSFVIEKIYSIPGLGQLFVNSVISRDYTAIMGLTVFYSLLLVSTVLVFDILSTFLDPRLRVSYEY